MFRDPPIPQTLNVHVIKKHGLIFVGKCTDRGDIFYEAAKAFQGLYKCLFGRVVVDGRFYNEGWRQKRCRCSESLTYPAIVVASHSCKSFRHVCQGWSVSVSPVAFPRNHVLRRRGLSTKRADR